MHWTIRKKEHKPRTDVWFAWYPVCVEDIGVRKVYVWLERVERYRTVYYGDLVVTSYQRIYPEDPK